MSRHLDDISITLPAVVFACYGIWHLLHGDLNTATLALLYAGALTLHITKNRKIRDLETRLEDATDATQEA
ncbi:hypothetical protein [Streptosporangium canum]|uniref:hypothetical protein n=1 Tax=Streptosporangium canum TaxID=324952 RepID=UPI0033A71275